MAQIKTEFYAKSDVKNVLKAIVRSNRDLTQLVNNDEAETYRAGFLAALEAVATAFGVDLEIVPNSFLDALERD